MVRLGDNYPTEAGAQGSGGSDGGTPASCAALGGTCILGPAACAARAPNGSELCNPDLNPGGAFCCLDRGLRADATVEDSPAAGDSAFEASSDVFGVVMRFVPQTMCDGSSLGANNTSNTARLALSRTGGLSADFAAGGSVYRCSLPDTATTSPAPLTIELTGSTQSCSGVPEQYVEVVSDPSQAYVLVTATSQPPPWCSIYGFLDTVPASGESPYFLPASTTSLLSDPATSLTLFAFSPTVLSYLRLSRSGTGSSTGFVSCLSPASDTSTDALSDAAAFHGTVVAVDPQSGVILGATFANSACTTQQELATNVNDVHAVAVGYSSVQTSGMFAFENGSDLYLCSSAGCGATDLSTPFASGGGTIAPGGLVFDSSPAPNLYWVTEQGLFRCAGVAPGGTCTPTLLVPGLQPTSGLAVDDTYVYYLQGMVLYRLPK
jgi:hypothetical protein